MAIGILTEKPSAKRNFSKALGGDAGCYNGEEYVIVCARGHLYEFEMPSDQVEETLRSKYKLWSLDNLPWDINDFKWTKHPLPDAAKTLKEIKNGLETCDEIVIGTDVDPSGEGELLAYEILDGLNLLDKKISRMYFMDESPICIQQAFTTRKELPSMEVNPDYIKADFRSKWDYMSMQFSRIATLCGDGKSVLRQGRLKSAMIEIVGQALDDLKNYKKIPFYENRFRDENGVLYSSSEEPQFPKKEDVPQNYEASAVVMDSKISKHTAPPKLLDLAGLSSRLAPKGFTAEEILATYQKMYESQIVSYPRTEDKLITHEQYNELLKNVDRIAELVGVDQSILTHRTERKTHIGKGSHGANRPGSVIPKSLKELDKFGKAAKDIYVLLALSTLTMFAEDYEYEQQAGHLEKYPQFKGTVSIPMKKGWKAVLDDDSEDEQQDSDSVKKGLGETAEPFVHEGFPKKPPTPTMKWLMKQLEKNSVGTGATRTSTYADVTNVKTKYPLMKDKKGKIELSEYGNMSYTLLKDTHIGSLAITEEVLRQMDDVSKYKTDPNSCLEHIAEYVKEDIATMQKNGENIEKIRTERIEGVWKGYNVAFNRIWGGYRFNDDECKRLLDGETIEFSTKNKSGDTIIITGCLEIMTYKNKQYVGFSKKSEQNTNPLKETFQGVWQGHNIKTRRVVYEYRFNDDECSRLLNAETITFIDGRGNHITGQLEKMTYNDIEYVGFKVSQITDANNKIKEYASGTWKRKKIRFLRIYREHRFTDEEVELLLKGETITFDYKNNCRITGLLKTKKYNGFSFVGFEETDFYDPATDDLYVHGIWKKKQVKFKKQWSGHTFTEEEIEKLLAGEMIEIENITSASGSTFGVKGKLDNYKYNGRKMFGFVKKAFL